MRVLVLWADNHSANLGVRVLAQGIAQLARQTWGDDVVVDFQNYGEGDSDVSFGARTALKDLGRRQGPLKTKLRQYDLVIDSGAGDSFADIYGFKRLVTMVNAHRLSKQLAIPVVMAPQTVGPFTTRIGRALARYSVRRMAVVETRDGASSRYAEKVLHTKTVTATDVVFALPVPAVQKSRDVLLNVSGLLWGANSHVDSVRYQASVRDVIRGLNERGRTVSLLAHVIDNPSNDNDTGAIQQLAAEFPGQVEALLPHDLDEARSLIASARLVIGSRMHACLNALSTGTPAVPWAYSRKFAPLLSDIGWDYGVDLRTSPDPAKETLDLIDSVTPATLDADVARVLQLTHDKLETAIGAFRSAYTSRAAS